MTKFQMILFCHHSRLCLSVLSLHSFLAALEVPIKHNQALQQAINQLITQLITYINSVPLTLSPLDPGGPSFPEMPYKNVTDKKWESTAESVSVCTHKR